MPFTVSHAAAVLPFRRLKLVWSAFIIGSMAPDFPYILGSVEYRDIGHVFPGILEFTIPASLLALWIFHRILKRPVIGLLPAGMQLRLRHQLGDFRFGGVGRFLAILGSIALGIATHVVWDSFTHAYTWAFYHIRWLRGWFHLPLIGAIPRHSVLQYASSVLGLAALGLWVLLWYRRTAPAVAAKGHVRPRSHYKLALGMFVLAGMMGVLRALMIVGTPATRHKADTFLLVFGVTALALAFWQLVLYCVLVSTHQVWTIN